MRLQTVRGMWVYKQNTGGWNVIACRLNQKSFEIHAGWPIGDEQKADGWYDEHFAK